MVVCCIYQFTHCFTRQTSDYEVIFDFCVDSASLATSFKKCNFIDKGTCPEIDNVDLATCSKAVNMRGI